MFAPEMGLYFNAVPYVDGSRYVDSQYIGGSAYFEPSMPSTLGIQADTDALTATLDWHYDALSVSGNYSGQFLVDVIPGGFEPDTYVYLPFTLQYQATPASYDSFETKDIDPDTLSFDWDAPATQFVNISGQINVDGNISTFNLTHPTSTPSWSGFGGFNTGYYPEGLLLNVYRETNTATETIFDQNINGQQIRFEMSSNLGCNGRFASGDVPIEVIAPEPVSSNSLRHWRSNTWV